MSSIYNSCDAFHKAPFGAVRAGQAVTFTLRVPAEFGCTAPRLVLHRDGEAPAPFVLHSAGGADGRDLFTITLPMPQPGLYFYYFDLYTGYRKLYRGALGEAYVTTGTGEEYQLTVYEAGFATPQAIKGGVMYQIFPDRFFEGRPKPMPFADRIYRENKSGEPYFWPTEQEDGYLTRDYFGGDFEGIRRKLPYLAGLGVTVIYLNPIFEAHSNHRYNTANYLKADPLLGTNEEFARLCDEAGRRGISIILDGVFSHTGSDSIYFNRECRYPVCGAYNSPDSPYRRWYDFSPSYPCGYRAWWGFDTLPEVNEHDESYREFICGKGGVIDTWLSLGAGGFRLDVADELPDDFIEAIRTAVKRHGQDKFLLGEVWEDATTKVSYGARRTYLLGKGLDAVMNYPFRSAILAFLRGGDARVCADAILRICENYPAPALHTLMNFVSTHDTERAITALAGESCEGKDRYWQSGRRLVCLAYAMLFTLPGIPSIYYGDEIGMQGYKDPFNRAYFEWDSTETRIIATLRNLAALRQRCKVFASGRLAISYAQDGVLCFERLARQNKAAVCINRTASDVQAALLGKNVVVAPYSFEVRTE